MRTWLAANSRRHEKRTEQPPFVPDVSGCSRRLFLPLIDNGKSCPLRSRGEFLRGGTTGSNPSPSSGESDELPTRPWQSIIAPALEAAKEDIGDGETRPAGASVQTREPTRCFLYRRSRRAPPVAPSSTMPRGPRVRLSVVIPNAALRADGGHLHGANRRTFAGFDRPLLAARAICRCSSLSKARF
jgi:hypothetical protein